MSTLPNSHDPSMRTRSGLTVVAICFATVIFDGYDVIVYGSVLPDLLAEPGWGLDPTTAGAIGSYTVVGMLLGALASGRLSDRVGRRTLILASVTWFSVAMGLCGFSTSPEMLAVCRFIAGLGLGGVLPSAIALTVEFAPRSRRQLYNALMSAGFPLGGVLAALSALALLGEHSWRTMFWIGVIPAVLIVPLGYVFLPESPANLLARGRVDAATRVARQYGLTLDVPDPAAPSEAGFRTLLGARWRISSLVFGVASLCALLLIYGLNTWLPQLMRQAGYPLGSALQFLLALNLGAVVLGTLAALASDRFGPKPTIVVSFGVAGAALFLLGSGQSSTVLLLLFVAVAGLGGNGTQTLINGYVAVHHPPHIRAGALGLALGVGRVGAIIGPLLGGLLLGSGIALGWNFAAFAVPALLGAALICAVPSTVAADRPAPSHPANTTEESM